MTLSSNLHYGYVYWYGQVTYIVAMSIDTV
jgi:hypothetical protein